MKTLIRPAFAMLALMIVITGLAYPLAITGLANLLFPGQAGGSLIEADGRPVGSALIGQNFSDPKYFWGRLSATGGFPYNGGASGGSNLGPLNPALADAVKARVEALRAADPGNAAPVPANLATASASGLDPHIGVAAAQYQVGRVARARGMSPDTLRVLIAEQSEGRFLGIVGVPRINVLRLNLALDRVDGS